MCAAGRAAAEKQLKPFFSHGFDYNWWTNIELCRENRSCLPIIPDRTVKRVIRPEFFERCDLTPLQRSFLEFLKAFLFMMESAAGSFEENQPSSSLQTAHQAGVLDELALNCLNRCDLRDRCSVMKMLELTALMRRCAAALRRLCTAGAAPLSSLSESRPFLGSLCRCVADRIDWSYRRQLFGSQHSGAEEEDLELSLSELPFTLAGEQRIERVKALLDFRDALLAVGELFDMVGDIRRRADELFPINEEKYWRTN